MASPRKKTALVVVDVQYDFLPPNGSLAVPEGRRILPVVQRLLERGAYDWDIVVASQDFHPPDHISFARNHSGGTEFADVELKDGNGKTYTQTLWPVHCVQDTRGVEIEDKVKAALDGWGDRFKIVRKGWHPGFEAYSAFAGYVTSGQRPVVHSLALPAPPDSDLGTVLRQLGVEKVVVVGLAEDYCVAATASSALEQGFQTLLLRSATACINEDRAIESGERLRAAGGSVVEDVDSWETQLKEWLGN